MGDVVNLLEKLQAFNIDNSYTCLELSCETELMNRASLYRCLRHLARARIVMSHGYPAKYWLQTVGHHEK